LENLSVDGVDPIKILDISQQQVGLHNVGKTAVCRLWNGKYNKSWATESFFVNIH
jgi:hypothetical protein